MTSFFFGVSFTEDVVSGKLDSLSPSSLLRGKLSPLPCLQNVLGIKKKKRGEVMGIPG